jgi:hypothetical protein
MPRLSGALAAITAAVVGVIANLSLWFALHVLFASVPEIGIGPLQLSCPIPAPCALPALIAAFAAWGLLARHWPLLVVLTLPHSPLQRRRFFDKATPDGRIAPLPLALESPMLHANRKGRLMARSIDYGNLMHRAMRG